jgi:hypothetical protein
MLGQGGFVKSRNGSVERQKKIINKNCVTTEGVSVYANQNYLADEPKSVSEKKFEKYMLANNPNPFPLTSLRFQIVLQPNLAPCCKQIEMTDSLSMDAKQLDFLTDLVLKYPVFSQVQFNAAEKVKYLIVYMSRYKKTKFSVGFL